MSIRASLFFGVLWLCVGCHGLAPMVGVVDEWAFRGLGCTIFANPQVVGLREVHLGGHLPAEGEVIVEGSVAEMSPYGTYLVLSDDAARLLVVLADVEEGEVPTAPLGKGRNVRILGSLESGKKGLPLLRAHSLKWQADGQSRPAGKA